MARERTYFKNDARDLPLWIQLVANEKSPPGSTQLEKGDGI